MKGRDLDLHRLFLEAFRICRWGLEGQLPLVPGWGSVSTACCGGLTRAAADVYAWACQRGLGVQPDVLTVHFDLPPLLQDGRTGLIAGSFLQAPGQVSGCGLNNSRLHETTVWQAFGRRARRTHYGFEVIKFFRNAVVAFGADGALRLG